MNYGVGRGVAGGGTGLVAALTLFLAEKTPEILRVTSGRGVPPRQPDLSCYTLVCVSFKDSLRFWHYSLYFR